MLGTEKIATVSVLLVQNLYEFSIFSLNLSRTKRHEEGFGDGVSKEAGEGGSAFGEIIGRNTVQYSPTYIWVSEYEPDTEFLFGTWSDA